MAAIMTGTRLDPQCYFEQIDERTERLLEVARLGLDAPVHSCPGWTVRSVVEHVADVYEHKVRVLADNAWPSSWPPAERADPADPLAALAEAKAHLFEEFARHRLDERTTTFSPLDDTVAFWVRRMALEIAIHGFDADAAHGLATELPDDLALDGVDEILTVMLAGPWWDGRVETAHPVDAVIAIQVDGSRWELTMQATSVTVGPASVEPVLTLSAPPADMFLWLWGRAGDGRVSARGDAVLAPELRALLVECTG